MHFSDSAILSESSAIAFCVSPIRSWPLLKRATSSCFSAARFFLSCARCQAILLLLSAIAILLIRLTISQRLDRENLMADLRRQSLRRRDLAAFVHPANSRKLLTTPWRSKTRTTTRAVCSHRGSAYA